ncbi:SRPBCC family protein [Paeniglutamicibacter sp. ORCA_105]|uniref:SRPBCC family protein n=1 Tax=Paeniglutamicibacter sp. ORCA_105 TaxID=3377336 RepID=UPI003895AA2E
MSTIGSDSPPQRAPWWWYPESRRAGRDMAAQPFTALAPGQRWFRAIDVDAPTNTVFEWVMQLRVAPHSYDLLDNYGRRSPQTLDRSLLDIQVGDSVMRIFTVTAVVPGASMTLRVNDGSPTRLFGPLSVHYGVDRLGDGSRLSAQLVVPPAAGAFKGLRQYALAWGDLVMMRRQLRELKRLAEQTAAES